VLSISTFFSFISDAYHTPKELQFTAGYSVPEATEIEPAIINGTDENRTIAPIQSQNSDHSEKTVDFREVWDEDEVNDEVNNDENLDSNDENDKINQQRMAGELEIRLLKEALPGNIMLPGEKTEEELNQGLESIMEQQHIQALIDRQEATEHDLQRYYDLQAKVFEDEIALIDYCNQMVFEDQPGDDTSNPFCKSVSVEASEKRLANETSLEELRQSLLN
jgi:hypothetical protein